MAQVCKRCERVCVFNTNGNRTRTVATSLHLLYALQLLMLKVRHAACCGVKSLLEGGHSNAMYMY